MWKPLVRQAVSRVDLHAIDEMAITSLNALRSIDTQGVTAEVFPDIIFEVFVTHLSDGTEKELVPGGIDTEVTFENRHRWADLVEQVQPPPPFFLAIVLVCVCVCVCD